MYISCKDVTSVAETPKPPRNKMLKLDFDSSDEDDLPIREPSNRYLIEEEIKLYKGLIVPNDDTQPLLWWNERVATFPILHKVAAKFLLVPATSVPCERLFSFAGHVCNKKRAALSAHNLERLVLLSQWSE